MLMLGSNLEGMPVLSLHVGGAIAQTRHAIVDPEDLSVRAYTLNGALIRNEAEIGDILDVRDVREIAEDGLIVDSEDVFVHQKDVIRINEIMELQFELIGLSVVAKSGKKLGKVVDYTIDTNTMTIYQIIVQRPLMSSFIDPRLTINRSQIVEIDDYKITIKNEKDEIKLPKKKEVEAPVPGDYVNPFRKAELAHNEKLSDKASSTSE